MTAKARTRHETDEHPASGELIARAVTAPAGGPSHAPHALRVEIPSVQAREAIP
jgi:hypothetical protein